MEEEKLNRQKLSGA